MKKLIFLTSLLLLAMQINIYAAENEDKPVIIIDNGNSYIKSEMDRSFNINDLLNQGIYAAEGAIDDVFEDEEVSLKVEETRSFIDDVVAFFRGIINFFRNIFNIKERNELVTNVTKKTVETLSSSKDLINNPDESLLTNIINEATKDITEDTSEITNAFSFIQSEIDKVKDTNENQNINQNINQNNNNLGLTNINNLFNVLTKTEEEKDDDEEDEEEKEKEDKE